LIQTADNYLQKQEQSINIYNFTVERDENVSPIHLCFKSQSLKVAQKNTLFF